MKAVSKKKIKRLAAILIALYLFGGIYRCLNFTIGRFYMIYF